ncbi:MAG: 50S ribosomal protein L25 [Chloroflexota bacterium]
MAEYKLSAELRTVTGKKVKRLRAQGLVPAVIYGSETDSINLQIPEAKLKLILRGAGRSSLVTIDVDSEKKNRTVLLRDIQYDIIRRSIQHVDFMQIVMGEAISTEVSISLVGDPPVEGTVLQDLTSLEIECLPSDLISSVEADISSLEIGDSLYIKDLQVPDTITILSDDDLLVAHVALLLREEEEEEVEEEVPEAGEVELVSDEKEEIDE